MSNCECSEMLMLRYVGMMVSGQVWCRDGDVVGVVLGASSKMAEGGTSFTFTYSPSHLV